MNGRGEGTGSSDPVIVDEKTYQEIRSGLTVVEKVEGLADGHVVLTRREDGEIELFNNGRNTTFLNGEKVPASKTLVLQTGDVITLGDSVLQLMITGLAESDA